MASDKTDDFVVPSSDGNVQGDNHPMPYKTVGSMTPGNAVTDGCDLSPEATNSLGKITSSTKSDSTGDA